VTTRRTWLALLLLLTADAARALVEASADNETLTRQAIDSREKTEADFASHLQARARMQATAVERVERLRTLPPDQIQDWVAGRVTETDLLARPRDAVAGSAISKTDAPLSATSLPSPASMVRLLTVGALCVISALMLLRKKERGRGRI